MALASLFSAPGTPPPTHAMTYSPQTEGSDKLAKFGKALGERRAASNGSRATATYHPSSDGGNLAAAAAHIASRRGGDGGAAAAAPAPRRVLCAAERKRLALVLALSPKRAQSDCELVLAALRTPAPAIALRVLDQATPTSLAAEDTERRATGVLLADSGVLWRALLESAAPASIELAARLSASSAALRDAAVEFTAAAVAPSSDELSPASAAADGASSCTDDDDESDDDADDEGAVAPHVGRKVVMVTGVAGFIGSHCAEALLARGDIVIGVDEVNDYYDVRLKRANLARLEALVGANENFRFFEGDLCDTEFITRIFDAERPRWMLHLAARAGVRPSIDDPFVYIHSNVEATTRLLELARARGCEHFVFASSSSVYGGSQKALFSESDDVSTPVSPYAATKKTCELLGHTYNHLYGLPVAGLRFFTVYGPGGRPDMAPFKFVDRVARGAEIQQFGDGSSSRDYTFVDDIVDGCLRTLDRPCGYQIYNLGNGEPTRLRDFIEIVQRNLQRQAIIKVLPDQPGDVPRTCADISKARALLGYQPKTKFADGMAKTVAWYQSEFAPQQQQQQQQQ